MRSTYGRPLMVGGIIAIIYTVSKMFTDETRSFLFHFSGGLFFAGFILFAVGFFSSMSANGIFRGFKSGFKKQQSQKLREIDAGYTDDEPDEEENSVRTQSARNRTAPYLLSGISCIVLSVLISFFS